MYIFTARINNLTFFIKVSEYMPAYDIDNARFNLLNLFS